MQNAQLNKFNPAAGVMTVNDPRGLIESICHEPVNSIISIFSRAGSVRSNHWHKTDWHICYVVSGQMEYYERPVMGFDLMGRYRVTKRVLNQGEWVKTLPYVEHTTVFPVDTLLLCFAKNIRDEDSYAADLVRAEDLSAVWRSGQEVN